MLKKIPKDYFDPSKGTLKLLWEEEWRGLGITQVRIKKAKLWQKFRSLTATFSRVWDGNTTRFTSRSHIFSFSSKLAGTAFRKVALLLTNS